MRIKIFVVLLMFFITSLYSQDKEKELFIKKLVESSWWNDGLKLSFENNNSKANVLNFNIEVPKQAPWDSGEVEINFNAKELLFKGMQNTYKWKYYITDKDLLYTEFIDKFARLESRIKSGSVRYYKNEKIITVGKKKIQTDNKIYIRENHDPKSDYYEFTDGGSVKKTFLNNDDFSNFKVIGHTENKYKINDKDDYWYLIELNLVYYSIETIKLHNKSIIITEFPVYAWIYGGYINLVDE